MGIKNVLTVVAVLCRFRMNTCAISSVTRISILTLIIISMSVRDRLEKECSRSNWQFDKWQIFIFSCMSLSFILLFHYTERCEQTTVRSGCEQANCSMCSPFFTSRKTAADFQVFQVTQNNPLKRVCDTRGECNWILLTQAPSGCERMD